MARFERGGKNTCAEGYRVVRSDRGRLVRSAAQTKQNRKTLHELVGAPVRENERNPSALRETRCRTTQPKKINWELTANENEKIGDTSPSKERTFGGETTCKWKRRIYRRKAT